MQLVVLAAVAAAIAVAMPAAAKPRVMSLNLCADQLLLALVEPDNVASVTWMASDPEISYLAERARGIPVNRGTAEEVLAFAPDLIVGGAHTARGAAAFLRRLDYPLLELDAPESIAEVRDQIAAVAAAVGEPGRGDALIGILDRTIAEVAAARGSRPPVLAALYQANGYTLGRGTLLDELLGLAGFDNLAAHLGLAGIAELPLERLILSDPELLVFTSARLDEPSLAAELARHPAFLARFGGIRSVVLPAPLWSCAGPSTAAALAALGEAAQAVGR